MLKLIVFSLSQPISPSPDLLKQCEENKVHTHYYLYQANESLLYDFIHSLSVTKEECLFITDSQFLLSLLKKEQITTIGIQGSLDQYLSDTSFVTDSLEDLSYSTISMVFSHDHGQAYTILTTSRTIVRELSLQDMNEYYALLSQPQIRSSLEDFADYETEKEKLKAYIKHAYQFQLFGLWGVYDCLTGHLIGQCGISLSEINQCTEYELGYLISSAYEGKSYAFECSHAIINYAFSELDCTRLVARIRFENSRSIALALRLGFTWETDFYESGHKYKLYVITKQDYSF